MRRGLNTRFLRFMCKFLYLWSNLLCSIRIKDITLEFLWPILGHRRLLLLHLSMLILGHLMSHLEFSMVKPLIRYSILAWCTLLKCSHQCLLLKFILHCKYLWRLCHTTHSHMVLHLNINSLLRLIFCKVRKLCHVTTKGRGRANVMIRNILSMIRSI